MKTILVLATILLSTFSYASNTKIDFIEMNPLCTLRVVTELPLKKHLADVLFLTGFSDRADNHKPLFSLLANEGYRVISFDYPSHGETNCLNLDLHNFTSISNLAVNLLSMPAYKSTKPLYLSGWSTGGLMAYRMLQRKYFGDRNISGAVMIAPGLSVYPIPGEHGIVTQNSLLSNLNPPHSGPIKPISPLLFLGFSSSLITNSVLAKNQDVPRTPILMLLGDDKLDVYADTADIRNWYVSNRRSSFDAFQCTGAKHEIDNEIKPIGSSARQLFLNFLLGRKIRNREGPCIRI